MEGEAKWFMKAVLLFCGIYLRSHCIIGQVGASHTQMQCDLRQIPQNSNTAFINHFTHCINSIQVIECMHIVFLNKHTCIYTMKGIDIEETTAVALSHAVIARESFT